MTESHQKYDMSNLNLREIIFKVFIQTFMYSVENNIC